MAVSSKSDAEKKVSALQHAFKQRLASEIDVIELTWEDVRRNQQGDSALEELYQRVDGLAGTAGSLGATDFSCIARELEQALAFILKESDSKLHLSAAIQAEIDELFGRLKQDASNWQPSGLLNSIPTELKHQSNNSITYLLINNVLLAECMLVSFRQSHYELQYFTDISDFEAACNNQFPSAIIIEDAFINDAEFAERLKVTLEACSSVIFISERDDIDARLAAARAGAHRYFPQPVNVNKLIWALDGLMVAEVEEPCRVLLVDDEEALLEYHAIVLREAGMVVETLSTPMQGLKVLNEFKPDVVVMDVYMPECSGPELAQIIRQDDAWALMPILFLSGEQGLERQLEAMSLGGDDFLVKPISVGHLVSAITCRVTKARKAQKLNKDLKNVLRENKFQLTTMDQHDIVSTADVAGRITSVNERFCEISGYSAEELIGQNHRMLKSGFHPDTFYTDMWHSISQGEIWRGTICNRKKNGEEYWVESTIVPFLDDKRKPYKYVSARTDVTALRKSEDRLYRSQTFANIGTWDWDITTGELYWSDRIGPLFGYQYKDIDTTYENFLAAVHEDDRQMVIDAVTNCVEHGATYDIEHRVVWPDGGVHWVQESGDVVRADDGTALHMLGVVQDINIRKHAELALEERGHQLQQAQAMAHIGNWRANMVSGELTWSDEIYRIFGFQPGSFEPSVEAFKKAVHPDDLLMVEASEKASQKTGRHDVVHRIVQPGGAVRYVHELAQAEADADGNLLQMSGTVQDITKQMEAETGLRRYNEILELIAKGGRLEDVLNVVIEHVEMMLNDGICSILLIDSAGKHLVNCIAPGLPDFYNEAIEGLEIGMGVGSCGESAFTGKRVIASNLMRHPNWQDFRELVKQAGLGACWSEPIFSSSGNVLGTFAIYYADPKEPTDSELKLAGELAQVIAIVVERNLSQQALIDSKEEAVNANRAKSLFLSSMSHELRTPMNAILGFSQLLKMEESKLDASQLENVDEILKAGSHLLELINEVLDLAKIEAGRIDLSIESIDINKIISESLQLIAPLAGKRGIEIKLRQNDADIEFNQLQPHILVRADHTRLRQVLLNLLSNAIKYNSENGTIIISCNSVAENQVRISITDTGAGLTTDQQAKLFKAFNRLGADQSETEGTGIGLVITKNIIELMGGDIGMDSEPGKGSTFWIELPSDGLDVGYNNEVDEMKSKDQQSDVMPEYEHNILYIEDNPANLRLVSQLLGSRSNIHMWSAHEPLLGLELAEEHKPDLILLDINLPGMDGYEVLKQLQHKEVTRDTVVIAISANAMPKDIEMGMAAGFSDYITKPIDIKVLLQAVDKALAESHK